MENVPDAGCRMCTFCGCINSRRRWKIKVVADMMCSYSQLFSCLCTSSHHFSPHSIFFLFSPPFDPATLPLLSSPANHLLPILPLILHSPLYFLLHHFHFPYLAFLPLSPLYILLFSLSIISYSHLTPNIKRFTSFTYSHRRRTETCVGLPVWSWWWLPSSLCAGRLSTSLSSSQL